MAFERIKFFEKSPVEVSIDMGADLGASLALFCDQISTHFRRRIEPKMPHYPATELPRTEMASAGSRSVRIRKPLPVGQGAMGVFRTERQKRPTLAFRLAHAYPPNPRVPRYIRRPFRAKTAQDVDLCLLFRPKLPTFA